MDIEKPEADLTCAPDERVSVVSNSKALSEKVLQFSKVSGALAGAGLLTIYLFGASVHAMHSVVSGVEPFDFTINKCLEYGVLFTSQVVYVLPVIFVAGAFQMNYFSAAGFLIVLPLALIFLLYGIRRTRFVRLKSIVALCLLAGLSLVLPLFAVGNIAMFSDTDLLLDPDVNLALSLGSDFEISELGFSDPGGFLEAAMFGEPLELIRRISAISFINILLPLASLAAIWISVPVLQDRSKLLCRVGARIISFLRAVSWFYLALSIFWLPGYLTWSTLADMPKVDASIEGLEELTSHNYLILHGEYQDRYFFYVPTEQRMVIVPKSKVNHIVILGKVSAFEDRSVFRKIEE